MQETSLIESTKQTPNLPKKKSWPLQFPAALSACLVRLGYGTAIFWTSPAVPHLLSSNSKFPITNDQASWIISLVSLGGFIGFLVYPLFINSLGRKYTMLLFAIPQVFSWILIYYASNVHHLYFARILSGVGYTPGYIVEIIYLGEIAEKNIRGLLLVLGKISYVLGCLITVMLGALVSYDNMNLILLLVPFLFILTFSLMPESPYFYLMANREEAAFNSLAKLRGSRDLKTLQSEIDNIKKGMFEPNSSKQESLLNLFGKRKNRRALLIVSLASLSVIFSGTMAVAGYMQTIISYNDNLIKPEHGTILVMLVVLISTALIAPVPDWLGRRILTLLFGIFTALGSAIIGAYLFCKFYLKTGDLSSISWIPLVALMIYTAASNPGLLCVSNILMAELFSVEFKSPATAIINIVYYILNFLLKLGLDRLIGIFEIYGVFWIFSVLTFVISVIIFIIMPETKGKTLEEIQEIL